MVNQRCREATSQKQRLSYLFEYGSTKVGGFMLRDQALTFAAFALTLGFIALILYEGVWL